MTTLLQDLRHAGRALRRNPGPVLVSVLSLSLGIAATATMISVVDAIDFRPLPYRDAGRRVQLGYLSPPSLFRHWQDRTRSYDALAAASIIVVAVGEDERVLGGSRVTGEFFSALGAVPLVGRTITPEDVRDGARVLVISHQVWQARFGGDPNVVGRTVPISWAGEYRSVASEPFTIIGVLPRGARYPRGSDVWLPALDELGGQLTVLGRLWPGVSIASARVEMEVVSHQLATEYPDTYGEYRGAVYPLRDAIRMMADRRGTSARFLLLSVAAFVLALAIINAAIVFLVRAARQEQDLVIRAALGAPRSRLVTLLLGQSLGVSLVAGALGVLLSLWGIQLADARMSVSVSGIAPVLDWRVISAALTLSLVAGLTVGLFPACRLGRPVLHDSLRPRTARGASGGAGGRLQGALVIAQVACALVLLSGAGVLTRDFVSLVTRDPGFDADRLVVAAHPSTFIASHTEATEVAERIAGLPGIVGAALGGLPAEGYAYRLENGDSLTDAERPWSYRVSADYFRTLGIPLLAGRTFLSSDRTGSAPVAIVSRMAARALWPGEVPIGKRLFMGNIAGGEWVTIVGLTADERVDRDTRDPVWPILYRPWAQLTSERRGRTQIFARTAAEPEGLVAQVLAVLRETRSGEGWQGERVTTMTAILGNTLALERFRTSALTLFSAFGLLLASMGIYGVVATVVNQRTAEIGIRVALGARPAEVLALVARRGIGLAIAGMAMGLAGAFAAHRVLQSLVVSETGFDPVATLAAGAFLVAAVVVACYLPGRRAVRIDPMVALRDE